MTRNAFIATLAGAAALAQTPQKQNPKHLENFADLKTGEMGRGLEAEPTDYDLADYERWTGYNGQTRHALYGKDGIPTGKMWIRFVRKDNPNFGFNLEVSSTADEKRQMLHMLIYDGTGHRAKTVRGELMRRGVDPEQWLATLA